MKFTSIQEAMNKGSGKVSMRGWVHRERGSNKLKFIVLRDSSNIIQCVVKKDKFSEEKYAEADKLQVEASLEIHGTIKEDKRAPTGYEVEVDDFQIVGACDSFPIKADQNREFMDDNRHLTLRTRRMTAIMKIRSTYVQARDEFYRKKGFFRFDAPILQPSQSEGGSTLFEVKYYDKKTYLSQSWQLYAESAIFALEKIYDMGPTFRAEKSKTSRHLSEFWMAEMEAAWWDLHQVSEFAKEEIRYCIKKVVEERSDDLKTLEQDPEKLRKVVEKDWPTIKYRDALQMLKEKDKMEVEFGKDLRTIEEEKLAKHYDTPVVVTHYPVVAMAFYKPRDQDFPEEALCFDMLSPTGVEIVGGSQRSLDIEDMKERLVEAGEDPSSLEWYFDLRRYGSVPHSGYGVGIERVLTWICGLDSVKDAIPFPRTPLRYKP
ncbi:asparagine--tRNA ligase [Candidatus Woesearchaeota archaeon]|nr:asparagine--tRNA ligase [Candidatus Woesearchaeota archaeon]